MTRLSRYQCAVMLATEILDGNPRHDELRIQQAVQDIRNEVMAGRRNRAAFREASGRARDLIEAAGHPGLHLVEGENK